MTWCWVAAAAAAAAKSLQSCLTLWPRRRQPTRLPRPWDSPGKNAGVGCHFLLQCMKVKSENEVSQSSLTLRNPVDCSLPGSSVHGIFQARVLERGATAFSGCVTNLMYLISLSFIATMYIYYGNKGIHVNNLVHVRYLMHEWMLGALGF